MALIQCPECGKRVSSFAKNCPECGYPIAKQDNELENNTEIAPNGIEEDKNDSQLDNEQVFLKPNIKKENVTTPNGERKEKTKKRKIWIITVSFLILILAGVFGYLGFAQDAYQKKSEAKLLYSQKEYLKLLWKVNEIPKFFFDSECETLQYAGSIGSMYSIAKDYSSDTGLGYLITSVWSASADTWYDSPNDDLSLTEEMKVIQKEVIQSYYSVLQKDYNLTEQQIDRAIEIGNDATNENRGDAFDAYVATLVNRTQDKTDPKPVNDAFAEYVSTNSVTLDNYDIQYNMANNLDKEFTLVGYAELDDYYNYGFDDGLESSYFCLQVTPEDGKYSNAWYIYCYRNSFQTLLDKTLTAGKKYVKMICYIPKGRFEKGQNNMAMLRYVVY